MTSLKRDKLSLDLFWIKDRSLTDTDALPAPEVIAAEIADDLEAALEQFTKIAARLGQGADTERPETLDAPSPAQITMAEVAAK
jgi:type I restriction enzyme M protein